MIAQKEKGLRHTTPVEKRRPAKIAVYMLMIVSSLISYEKLNANDNTTTNYQEQLKRIPMKTVLIIGINPETIDFTNPELPKGLNKETVVQGTNATVEKLGSLGYQAEVYLVDSGASDLSKLEGHLKNNSYDGIVIGNGIRGQASNFYLFELIINIVHANAPKSKIIFNTLPTNTDEAVRRWL